jgi:hypothetical protein
MNLNKNDVDSGASLSNEWLGVNLPPGCSFSFHVSNEELAAAIAYAYERCDQTYTAGNTETGKVMLEHLKDLLKIQRTRWGLIETPNVKLTGLPLNKGGKSNDK